MKYSMLLLILAAACAPAMSEVLYSNERLPVNPEVGEKQDNPMMKIVTLLSSMEAKIRIEGRREQQSFDTYSCWCERELTEKAASIAKQTEEIPQLNGNINKLAAEIASHTAEVKQLDKDIAENEKSQKEATSVRNKENAEYNDSRQEAEQVTGALETAIKVLTGATSGFLQKNLQQAKILSVISGLRRVLKRPEVARKVSDQDLEVAKHFVSKPEDFMNSNSEAMSAMQTSQNPMGDYAPQSTQIQGILKGMYDAFTTQLEKDNAAEATRQKQYEELIQTKAAEMQELQASSLDTKEQLGAKTEDHAGLTTRRDNMVEENKADSKYFDETKYGCQNKAKEWSTRSRMRSEELQGIEKAKRILLSHKSFSDEKDGAVQEAPTLFQVVERVINDKKHKGFRAKAYKELKMITSKYHSVEFAEIAASLKTGSHFDKVITMIDKQMDLLVNEGKVDVWKKQKCEEREAASKNTQEQLQKEVDHTKSKLASEKLTEEGLMKAHAELEESINKTKDEITQLDEIRDAEEAEFKATQQDNREALKLMDAAYAALMEFYEKNGIAITQQDAKPLVLAQEDQPGWQHELDMKSREEREAYDPDRAVYSVEKNEKAPQTVFSRGEYVGHQDPNNGVLHMLNVIQNEVKDEIKAAQKEDDDAYVTYRESMKNLKATLEQQESSRVAVGKNLAEVQAKETDEERLKRQFEEDLGLEWNNYAILEKSCEWVKQKFQERVDLRKNEMDGLKIAKQYLLDGTDGSH